MPSQSPVGFSQASRRICTAAVAIRSLGRRNSTTPLPVPPSETTRTSNAVSFIRLSPFAFSNLDLREALNQSRRAYDACCRDGVRYRCGSFWLAIETNWLAKDTNMLRLVTVTNNLKLSGSRRGGHG